MSYFTPGVANLTGGNSSQPGVAPVGMVHPLGWFQGKAWQEGPAYQTPVYQISAGYQWPYQPYPNSRVWIWDTLTNNYYAGYYYPQYGYYAWAWDPLTAVAQYDQQICIQLNDWITNKNSAGGFSSN